jgi:hypothetical protein
MYRLQKGLNDSFSLAFDIELVHIRTSLTSSIDIS